MTRKAILLLSAAIVFTPVASLHAESRYSTPAPVTLSPDLTQPWLLQLQNAPTRQKSVQKRKWQAKQQKKRKSIWGSGSYWRNTEATGIFAPLNRKKVKQQRIRKKQVVHRSVQPTRQSSNAQVTSHIKQTQAQRPIDPRFLPTTVNYQTSQKPGTIIVDTNTRHLYLVLENGKARRYGVGVGKEGFEWKGTQKITRKAEWPSWTPPKEMIARERKKGRILPSFMEGGPANPMGARALYLGSTLYRIHGTNQPWTIGKAVSSGCIRMRNEDVMELYERAQRGAKVIVT